MPHLGAIRASVRAGFRFRHLPSHSQMLALHGFRARSGVMDMYLARDVDDAFTARVRLQDLELPRTPPPLWHDSGSVADVVLALLEIPEHGRRVVEGSRATQQVRPTGDLGPRRNRFRLPVSVICGGCGLRVPSSSWC